MKEVKRIIDEANIPKVSVAKFLGVSRQMLYNYMALDKIDDLPGDKKTKLLMLFGVEKEKRLLEADLFIMTSRFEGLPMGLIEALSYGIPCAVTDGTYMDKEIKEYDAGWTSDTTIEGITRMLECICDKKQLYPEKGGKARLLAHNYNWDVIAKRTHDEYMKLI